MPIPQLWTDDYLSDLQENAEIEISTLVPCIYVRFPLNIVAGQTIYNFLTDVSPAQRLTGIIRVTYLGKTVHPVSVNALKGEFPFLKPVEGETRGRVLFYMRTGYGMDGIKFNVAPASSITYNGTDNINTVTGIRNNVIVAGWRIADPQNPMYQLPDWIREKLIMYWVLSKAYRKEGKGQNLDAAKMFDQKYNTLLVQFKTINMNIFNARMHGIRDQIPGGTRGGLPPRPVLPPNFGTLVR